MIETLSHLRNRYSQTHTPNPVLEDGATDEKPKTEKVECIYRILNVCKFHYYSKCSVHMSSNKKIPIHLSKSASILMMNDFQFPYWLKFTQSICTDWDSFNTEHVVSLLSYSVCCFCVCLFN